MFLTTELLRKYLAKNDIAKAIAYQKTISREKVHRRRGEPKKTNRGKKLVPNVFFSPMRVHRSPGGCMWITKTNCLKICILDCIDLHRKNWKDTLSKEHTWDNKPIINVSNY